MANPIIQIKRISVNLPGEKDQGYGILNTLQDGELGYNAYNNGLYIGYNGSNYLLSVANSNNIDSQTFYGNVNGTATSAAKLTTNAGKDGTPVYFSDGKPVACTTLTLNTSGKAGSADKWATPRKISISSTTGDTGTNVDGSADATLIIPKTLSGFTLIKADTFEGTLSGTATVANKLSVNAGSETNPVYFTNGVPTACSTTLAVSITGNSETATKWATPRTISISGTVGGTAPSIDGSANITLVLPKTLSKFTSVEADTFIGTLSGTAAAANKLSTSAGDVNIPVYFKDGKPVACTSLNLDVTKNAATATKLKEAVNLSISGIAGDNEVAFDGSADIALILPKSLSGFTKIKASTFEGSLTGTASSANKLNTSAGDVNTPVYFESGVPKICTILGLDTTGNAATATKWKSPISLSISGTAGTTGTNVDGSVSTSLILPLILKGFTSIEANTFTGTLSGTASSALEATKLKTARNIQVNLGSTSAASFNGTAAVEPGVKGTLGLANGGTGATTAKGASYNLLSDMNAATSEITDSTYFVFKYAEPSSSNGALYHRQGTSIWTYIKNKISSDLGLTSSAYNGNASTATTWKTTRKLTIGNTGKNVNGSADVSWTLAEIGAAPASHNHTSLTGITKLSFASESSDQASISTTISDTSTYFDFNLGDDPAQSDMWRWRFTPSGGTVFNAMTLDATSATAAKLTVTGNITASTFTGNLSGNASTATKATQDGSGNVITSTYETKTDATAKLTTAKSYTDTSIANLINGAPTTLDTLKEIADAMAANDSVVEALDQAIGNKSDKIHTHKVEHTPAGTVSQPTFTGSSVTSGKPSDTTTVYSITNVGSVATLTASVSNRCLTLTFGGGTVPTRVSVVLPTNEHTHNVTASGTVSQPTFTGTKATITSGTASA